MELLKVYPKDITLVIELPLKEAEGLLDYMDSAQIVYDSQKQPDFVEKVKIGKEFFKSLDLMCKSVKEHTDA